MGDTPLTEGVPLFVCIRGNIRGKGRGLMSEPFEPLENMMRAAMAAKKTVDDLDAMSAEEYFQHYIESNKKHRDRHLETAAKLDSLIKLVEANKDAFKDFLQLIKEL